MPRRASAWAHATPAANAKKPTVALARRLREDAVRYQGNWLPHRLRSAVEDGVRFVGDSAGHCFPLSGEGIGTAFYFGIAAGREIAAAWPARRTGESALQRHAGFHERHRPTFRRALSLQRLIPALPPRTLTLGLRALAHQSLVDRARSAGTWTKRTCAPPRRRGTMSHEPREHDETELAVGGVTLV